MGLSIFAVCAYPDGKGYARLDHSATSRAGVERSARAFGYERIIGFAESEKDANAIIAELNRLAALTPTAPAPASTEIDEIGWSPAK